MTSGGAHTNHKAMKNVCELQHPLVHHHLVRLRDKHTSPERFRSSIHRLSVLLSYEATKDLDLKTVPVETPLTMTEGRVLRQRIAIVPILRAGLGMVEPVLDLIPVAQVWHLGFYRDETTHEPVEYYKKLPHNQPVDLALVLDPMLATGGSAIAAIRAVQDWGVNEIRLLAMIAAPEGIKKVHQYYPDTRIYVCAIDKALNENAFIVPGLGDAGDRIFNAHPELEGC